MAFGPDILEYFNDATLGVDQESRAQDAFVLTPGELLQTPCPVKITDLVILVSQEGKRQIVFCFEFGVLFW